MKESLAHCLSGPINLDEKDWERPVDRLHALACAARESKLASLGVSWYALKGANRADMREDCVTKLAELLWSVKPKPPEVMRVKIARWAIQESLIDMCPHCKGAKEVPAQDGLDGAQRMKPCPPDPVGCGGTGLRRYSDRERVEGLEIDGAQLAQHQRLLGAALTLLTRAEHEAGLRAFRLLERW